MIPLSRRELLAAATAISLAENAHASAEPHFWTATQAAEQIRKRKISSEELTRLCLDRIKARAERLNAFITLTADRATEQARAMDRQRDSRGLLHGVPVALKDNIDTAGIRTTAAAKFFLERVPPEDAEVARRTMAAGAVMLGKLNLDEFAFAGTGTTGCFGPARNPWNVEHITGGSSAGSGAALADGLCFASIGSDDGGSVRIPGSHCGVVGLKPSFGRISTRGIVPSAYSLDCPGPMARTVEDAALMLAVLAGNDPQDAIVLDRPVPEYARALRHSIAAFRIGIPRKPFFETLHPGVAARVEDAIQLLKPRVREVREIAIPMAQEAENGSTDIELYHYHREFFESAPEKYHPWSRRLLERAKRISAERYVETLKRIREARRDARCVFEQVDILLLPTMREPAPRIDETVNETHRRPPSNTGVFNRLGLPALTVPCGFSRDKLPVGLQIVGPYFEETAVLAAAFAYQQAAGWTSQHP